MAFGLLQIGVSWLEIGSEECLDFGKTKALTPAEPSQRVNSLGNEKGV